MDIDLSSYTNQK